jgi:hypothetical protein
MRNIILLLTLVHLSVSGFTQNPFTYQGVALDPVTLEPLNEQTISIKLELTDGMDVLYAEEHSDITTSKWGKFSIAVGTGDNTVGNFAIDYSRGNIKLITSIDLNNGSNYSEVGSTDILHTPNDSYAEFASRSTLADTALFVKGLNLKDNDSTNELQQISLLNDTIFLSKGGFVSLPKYNAFDGDSSEINEIQALTVTGTTLKLSKGGGEVRLFDGDSSNSNELQFLTKTDSLISLSNGGSIVLADDDNSNEIQFLTKTNNRINLSNGGSVVLVDDDNSNEIQLLSIKDDTLFLSQGNQVSLKKYLDANANQTLSISGRDISLTKGGNITLPADEVYDGDSSTTNELQTISRISDTLFLTDGGRITLPEDEVYDGDSSAVNELQVLSISNDTISLTNGGFVVLPEVETYFEKNGSTLRLTSGYDSTDFIIGSPVLNYDSDSSHMSKFFFDKEKGAFRAGWISNENWDEDSLGFYSSALGYNTKANGLMSTSYGRETEASGSYSTAAGLLTTASGQNSTALGSRTKAIGTSSTSLGSSTQAIGSNSTAMGSFTKASGQHSLAGGVGSQSRAYASVAMGLNTKAMVNYSTAFGQGTQINSVGGLVIGTYNDTLHEPYPLTSSALFIIGNGNSGSTSGPILSNAFTVYENGEVEINQEYTLPNVDGDSLQVLTTDGNGKVSWKSTAMNSVFEDKNGVVSVKNDSANFELGGKVNSFGNEVKLMFNHKREALRGGVVYNNQWADDSLGYGSIAFGDGVNAKGNYSQAFGFGTLTSGLFSFASGSRASSQGNYSFSSGRNSLTTKDYAIAIGDSAEAFGVASISLGSYNDATGDYSLSIGRANKAEGDYSIALGFFAKADGFSSVSIGRNSEATNWYAYALGNLTKASDWFSLATGYDTKSSGRASTAMGYQSEASGDYSFSSGYKTTASGLASAAMGYESEASGDYSYALGRESEASGSYSLSAGRSTEASGFSSSALGYESRATGSTSTAMGRKTRAAGTYSTALGYESIARGNTSYAAGIGIIAKELGEYSVGSYNDTLNSLIFSVGNGSANNARNNAFQIYKSSGNAYFDGSVFPITDNSEGLGTSILRWSSVWSTNGTIQTSDTTLKDNIEPLSYGVDELMRIKTISYNWKDDERKTRKIGFNAQNLLEVIPEVVETHSVHVNEETGEESYVKNETLGVYYSDIIPVLTKAIQEQQQQIEKLKEELERLKSKE